MRVAYKCLKAVVAHRLCGRCAKVEFRNGGFEFSELGFQAIIGLIIDTRQRVLVVKLVMLSDFSTELSDFFVGIGHGCNERSGYLIIKGSF